MILQETSNWLLFTKEIFHGKHHLFCNENIFIQEFSI